MKAVNKVLTTGAVITTLGLTGVGAQSAFADEVTSLNAVSGEIPDAGEAQPDNGSGEIPDAGEAQPDNGSGEIPDAGEAQPEPEPQP
ncbi:hypothetical protein, partial [Staphylococcus aureus]|uniref:hypothetical protein n=1 Tax=Staphylococcus aureus TaxID=1280 RepID=UPI001965F70A